MHLNFFKMLQTILLLTLFIAQAFGIPRIGITRDFTSQDQIISYSAAIRLESLDNPGSHLKNLPDNKVLNLIKIAYDEMRIDYNTNRPNGDIPSVMVGLATDDGQLHLASSLQRGRDIFLEYPKDENDPLNRFDKIRHLLKSCEDGTHNRHNFFGKCGEPSVVELYMSRHGGFLEDQNGSIRGRMWAWNGQQSRVVQPCPNDFVGPGRYGCRTFMTKWLPRIRLIGTGTPDSSGQDEVGGKIIQITKWWRNFTCERA